MASFTSYKIDFTPPYTSHYWRVELVVWLIKKGDPGLKDGKLDEITIASSDIVRAEFSLALTCQQVVEIRRGRSISKTWARLEDIFEYYGPADEAPLYRQVAHQFLDGRPETKRTLRSYLDEIERDRDTNSSNPSPLTILRNLVTYPKLFKSRRKITGALDALGVLCGVEQLCGCNPYVPTDEIPESHRSLINCLYCKYDTPGAKETQGSDPSDEGKNTQDPGTVPKPGLLNVAQPSKSNKKKPYMKIELLSVLKLTASEHNIMFKRDEATIWSNAGDVKFRASRAGARFFKMELDGVKTQPPDYSDLITWHRRLGHIDFHDLHCGYRQFAYRGLKIVKPGQSNFSSCRICQTIKMPALPLRPVPKAETEILEIVHADFCGPIPGESKGTALFIITFTDDASGWMAMYFIRHCTEILKFFKDYVTQAESQCRRKIRKLQSNDSLGKDFDEYLKTAGIERLNIPTDTQHIRALTETTKCILLQSGLNDSFYCEALKTACFIRNRSSSVRLEGLTPYQKWYGRPPSLRHMHEFGAKVSCVVRKDPSQAKLETKEGQYLGYTKKKRAYKIWIPDYKQIVLSDEVDFYEYVNPKIENRTGTERQQPNADGTAERPGTSRDSDEANNSRGKETKPAVPECIKMRTKYTRSDKKPKDRGSSTDPPKHKKDIRDYLKGKYNHFQDESWDEDSDSEEEDTIYEEDEPDTTEKGRENDAHAERRVATDEPVSNSTTQSTLAESSAEGAGPGAIPRSVQGAPGLEGTRPPPIPNHASTTEEQLVPESASATEVAALTDKMDL